MAGSRTRLQVPGYQVMDYLGSGARSTIWRVRERSRNRFYALKRVTKPPGDDHRFFEQAINEYEVASEFDHPAIRKYYEVRRIRKWLQLTELHIFMELCEGASVQAKRPEEMDRALAIFRAVAEGLAHMHQRGYIHGDMKPNNIIVAADGTVKLIDFGQSCPLGTIKERIQGTPDFIAPEQVHRRPLDARTDVFNFAAALYWTLVGQPIPTIMPKNGNTVQLVNELRVTPASAANPDVPAALDRLLHDCIEMNPSRRPQDMREVIARLELIASSLGREQELPTDEMHDTYGLDDTLAEGLPNDFLEGLED